MDDSTNDQAQHLAHASLHILETMLTQYERRFMKQIRIAKDTHQTKKRRDNAGIQVNRLVELINLVKAEIHKRTTNKAEDKLLAIATRPYLNNQEQLARLEENLDNASAAKCKYRGLADKATTEQQRTKYEQLTAYWITREDNACERINEFIVNGGN